MPQLEVSNGPSVYLSGVPYYSPDFIYPQNHCDSC